MGEKGEGIEKYRRAVTEQSGTRRAAQGHISNIVINGCGAGRVLGFQGGLFVVIQMWLLGCIPETIIMFMATVVEKYEIIKKRKEEAFVPLGQSETCGAEAQPRASVWWEHEGAFSLPVLQGLRALPLLLPAPRGASPLPPRALRCRLPADCARCQQGALSPPVSRAQPVFRQHPVS